MEAFGMYLLKSAVWLTGFTLIFLVFLRNERFFGLNRAFLLSGIFASIIFPLFTWHYAVVLPPLPVEEIPIPEMTGEVAYIPAPEPSIPFYWWIYILGITFLAFRLIFQTIKVIKKLRKTGYVKNGPIKIVRTPEYHASFSFFSFVFVNPSTPDIEAQEIVNHESGHIQNRHWFDLLLMELLRILQWFNPFAWVYAHLVRQNHEYLADEIALRRSSNPAIYQAALLNQVFGVPVISLANSFSNSLNKKRFTMMKKKIYSPFRKLRLLMVLPLIATVFYAFARPEYVESTPTTSENITSVAKEGKVKGTVTNEKGNPLEGAAVVIKGTTMGSTTDANGDFVLKNVPSDAELVISYVGLKTQELKPDFDHRMKIQMGISTVSIGTISVNPEEAFSNNQGEVQVIGYGVQKKDESDLIEVSRFLILIEAENDEIKLTGMKGCHWKKLSFKLSEGNKQAVDQFGMSQNKTKEESDNSSFLFTIRKTEKGLTLEGIKGTAWINLSFNCNGNCREAVNQNGMTDIELTNKVKEGKSFSVVEQMPEFPGGYKAMVKYLMENTKYPTQAKEEKTQGTVLVKFTINQRGKIEDAKVIKGIHKDLDDEALRVISSMPDWNPGKQNGKPVEVEFTIPVEFSLQDNKSNITSKNFQIRLKDNSIAIHPDYPPLIMLDGKEITNEERLKINPNSIGSISVFKDESATKAYGEKGKNGVIVITSKLWNGAESGKNELYFYREIDEKPQFPGGKTEMMRFLARNMKYPVIASEKGAEGTALARFTVTQTGQIANVSVINDIDPSIKSEAVRIIMKMPVWDPGKKNGKAVDVVCSIPFKFIINKSGTQQTTGDTRSLPGDFGEVTVVGYGSSRPQPELSPGEDRPFVNVEEMPEFPGGQKELMKFINNNLKYPPEASAQGIQGTVVIQFVVTKAGKLDNPKVIRGVNSLLDEEALRVLKLSPDWIPGKQGGKPVSVYFTLPFRFVLSSSSPGATPPPPPPVSSENK